MEIQMELAAVFAEPVLRRCWLLNKALESASLDEALKLARAADEFLGMGQPNPQTLANTVSPDGLSTAPNQDLQPTLQTAAPRDDRAGDAPSTSITDHIAFTADIPKDASAATNDTDEEDASSESCAEEAGTEEDSEPQLAMTSGLAVLAGMDDIVRYLRQQDDVVVSVARASYLVNGRFQLNSGELLARANKIRERQGKPLFQRVPYRFPSA